MSNDDYEALAFAIQHDYSYQMYLDDLPLWGLWYINYNLLIIFFSIGW